jgi:protein TonB
MSAGEEGAAQARVGSGREFSTLVASKPRNEGGSTIIATMTSLVTHGAIVALAVWTTMGAGPDARSEDPHDIFTVMPIIDQPIPPPPPTPPEQAPPVDPLPEMPFGHQLLVTPDVVLPTIPPPQTGNIYRRENFSGLGVPGGTGLGTTLRVVTEHDPGDAPVFTPMTVAPVLKNVQEVERVLEQRYPAILRDAGIGGQTRMWFYIDENGNVVKSQIFESSGHKQLDELAVSVAKIMRFTPAKNMDKAVAVWVQIPITFTARLPEAARI